MAKKKEAKKHSVAKAARHAMHDFHDPQKAGKTTIWSVHRQIMQKPAPFLVAFFIDFLFITFMVVVSKILTTLVLDPSDVGFNTFVQQYAPYLLVGLVAYYFTMLLAYSAFKYVVLHKVRQYADKARLTFKRFWGFYAMNLSAAAILSLVFIMVVLGLGLIVKQQYLIWFRDIFLVLVFLVIYSLINSAHSSFAQGDTVSSAVGKALKMFCRKDLYKILASFAACAVIAYGLAFMFDAIFRYLFLRMAGLPYYCYYWTVGAIVFLLASLVFGYHRILFYLKMKEQKF